MGRTARRWLVLPGLAETAEEFGAVRRLVPESYEVVVVDPWRTPVTAPVDVLRQIAGTGPIGLVGHSIGGLAALRWALAVPDQVVALVLVDSSLPSEDGRTAFYPGRRGDRAVRHALRGIGRLGLPRVVGPVLRDILLWLTSTSGRDPLRRATVRDRYGAHDSWLRFWNELAASWPLAAEVGRLLDGGARPVATVQLVAGGSRLARPSKRWLRGQRGLSRRLGSRLVVLPDAAHLVHIDRPDAIAAAIVEIGTAPRRASGSAGPQPLHRPLGQVDDEGVG
jgi:pimeloyl-ACP methyl ester carboxylesterase